MKKLNKSIITGLIILSAISASVELLGNQEVMDYSRNKQDASEKRQGHMQRPDPAQVIEHLFDTYDADGDGELAGSELSETVSDIVAHRPPRPEQDNAVESDPDVEAEQLEVLLLTEFDLDENGAILPEELFAAMAAMKPAPPRRHGR